MRKKTPDKKSLLETTQCILNVALILSSLLFLGVLPLQNDHSQSSMVTSVLASRALSSHTPRGFRSDSGQSHLFFLHETQEFDFGDNNFYHTYELEDHSWSVPFSLKNKTFSDIDFLINFMVIQSESREEDFDVYYNTKGELFKTSYNGQSHQWLDSEKIFGKLDIHDYLDLPLSSDLLSLCGHSLFYLSDEPLNVVWSFKSRNVSLFNHEYERHYLISTVFSNGTIRSQVIPGLDPFYHFYSSLNFVSRNASLIIYSPQYFYRSILLPNGSWSKWQHSGFAASLMDLHGKIHGKLTQCLIHNHYLVSSHKDEDANINWVWTDLTATNLSVHPIHFPNKLDPGDTSIRATFKLRESTNGGPSFLTAFVTNSSIELWMYHLQNDTWTLISQLAYSQVSTYDFYAKPEIFNIDLLADGPTWRVFWNQQVKAGTFLHELFTVSYHTNTGNWSQVTQITDTRAITDDYTDGVVPGFSLVILSLSFLIIISLRRIKKPVIS